MLRRSVAHGQLVSGSAQRHRIDLEPGQHAGSRYIDVTTLTGEGKVRY
jgi:hypothetical protein